MRSFLSLCFVLLAIYPLWTQSCDCPAQFEWLQETIRHNYPGYADKVTPATQADLERHTALITEQVSKVHSDTACLRQLLAWAGWFADRHIQLSYEMPASDPEIIRRQFAQWEHIPMREAEARRLLDTPERDPVEGIYANEDGVYRVALLRNPTPEREFAAIVLRADSVYWMPGQVKFDMRRTAPDSFVLRYYMRDHSERILYALRTDSTLVCTQVGVWQKIYPGNFRHKAPDPLFFVRELDAETVLIRLGSMQDRYRATFDSLVKAQRPLLESRPNWIIDCRGNGGGSDWTFFPLRPYLYTGPVPLDNMLQYATPLNRQKYVEWRGNHYYSWLERRYAAYLAFRMKGKDGRFIGKCGAPEYKLREVLATPARIAVLVDGGCGSSCEQFLLYARASAKTTLIGQNSAGVLDYSNLHTTSFPYQSFKLSYPTTRSCRVDRGAGIDGVGIPPHIHMEDPKADWVEFARNYLKGLKPRS